MIKITNTDVYGWEAAVRGMRNPMNSWDKSDTIIVDVPDTPRVDYHGNVVEIIPAHKRVMPIYKEEKWIGVGENDLKLMKSLSKAGTDHSKYLRMINVTFDLTAPLYFLKEWDTYKVSTVSNSCSTMHKIHEKEFTLDDFSHEHLVDSSMCELESIIERMNFWREKFIIQNNKETCDCNYLSAKMCWWQMIQLLPSSYNQKRTVQLNYQVLKNMYHARKSHKLDEWREFCKWCETLPYFREICIEP